MRILNPSDAVERQIEGVGAAMEAFDFMNRSDLIVGLRTLAPHARAPKPNTPPTGLGHMILVTKGHGMISNGEYYEKLGPGTVVSFRPGETPYFQAGAQDLVFIEIAYPDAAAAAPPVAAPKPQAAVATTKPVKGAGVYMEA